MTATMADFIQAVEAVQSAPASFLSVFQTFVEGACHNFALLSHDGLESDAAAGSDALQRYDALHCAVINLRISDERFRSRAKRQPSLSSTRNRSANSSASAFPAANQSTSSASFSSNPSGSFLGAVSGVFHSVFAPDSRAESSSADDRPSEPEAETPPLFTIASDPVVAEALKTLGSTLSRLYTVNLKIAKYDRELEKPRTWGASRKIQRRKAAVLELRKEKVTLTAEVLRLYPISLVPAFEDIRQRCAECCDALVEVFAAVNDVSHCPDSSTSVALSPSASSTARRGSSAGWHGSSSPVTPSTPAPSSGSVWLSSAPSRSHEPFEDSAPSSQTFDPVAAAAADGAGSSTSNAFYGSDNQACAWFRYCGFDAVREACVRVAVDMSLAVDHLARVARRSGVPLPPDTAADVARMRAELQTVAARRHREGAEMMREIFAYRKYLECAQTTQRAVRKAEQRRDAARDPLRRQAAQREVEAAHARLAEARTQMLGDDMPSMPQLYDDFLTHLKECVIDLRLIIAPTRSLPVGTSVGKP